MNTEFAINERGERVNLHRVLIHKGTGERRKYYLFNLTDRILYDADYETGRWDDEEDLQPRNEQGS